MSLDDTTHCLLYGKRTEKLLMLSTVMRTANELIERVTSNVTSCMIFLEGLLPFGGGGKRLLHIL
jgi:hypothetical protein